MNNVLIPWKFLLSFIVFLVVLLKDARRSMVQKGRGANLVN
jgi:hypothetical protein